MDIRGILGLPDLLDVRSLLCIQPHPDDNEVGAGGTLITLARRSCRIVFVTVTDGGAGMPHPGMARAEVIATRNAERQRAGELLGVAEQIALDFPDAGAYDEEEVVQRLIPILREYRPELVMTVDPWTPYESHPDHLKTGRAVAQAMLFAGNYATLPGQGEPYTVPQIAFYASSYPNTYVDITPCWEGKLAALLAHRSQFENAEWPLLSTYLAFQAGQIFQEGQTREKMLQAGESIPDQHQAHYAEAFKLLSVRQLHFFPQAMSG